MEELQQSPAAALGDDNSNKSVSTSTSTRSNGDTNDPIIINNEGNNHLIHSSSVKGKRKSLLLLQQLRNTEQEECECSLILDFKIDPIIGQHMTLVQPGQRQASTYSCWETSLIYIQQT